MSKTKINMNKISQEGKDLSHYQRIYLRYKLYGINMFRYENLPEKIEERYIEKGLFEYGQVAFYNHPSIGLICVPCSGTGKYNYQGEPLGINLHLYGGDTIVCNDETKFVRMINNDEMIATKFYVQDYAKKMYEVERTIEANIAQQKFPYLFVTNDKTEFAMKTVFRKLQDGEFAIFSGKDLDLENSVKVLNTNVPYVVDKLNQYKYELEREILTFFGLNNNFEKKERLLADEVNSNNDYVNTMIDIMFRQRQLAIEKVNKKFDTTIIVKKVNGVSQNVSRETTEGGEK